MPDLPDLLASAVARLEPSRVPAFGTIERRSLRRTRCRRGAAVAALVTGTVAIGSVAAGLGSSGSSARPIAAPAPCVTPFYDGGRDVRAAIPAQGSRRVSVFVGGALTVGWANCSETGTLASDDTLDRYLTEDAKAHLLHGAPHNTPPVTPQHQFRLFAYETGTVTLTGSGSEGSHGSLVVRITTQVEPVGATEPSPYPYNPPTSGVPDLCDLADPADPDGRLTVPVSFENSNVLAPPGSVTSRFDRPQVLARYAAGHRFAEGGHPQAYFGLLSAQTPAHINPDGTATPLYTRKPVWLVAVCDLPESSVTRFGGPISFDPTPAPGTSPSPGAPGFATLFEPYDEAGQRLETITAGRSTPEQRRQRYIEVPFTRNHRDSADGRQIGISYPADEPCATFSHLAVVEAEDQVQVRVWLLMRDDTADRCTSSGSHEAVIGLRTALGTRPLVRGGAFR
jgi:hypothetical protein